MSPRLFVQVVGVEARKRMSYRVDFWINTVVGFLAGFGVAYFVAQALFGESGAETIAGFTRQGLVLYYVAVLLIERIVRGPDFGGHIAEDIYEGGLTRYLLFPAPYLAFKYAQHLGALLPLVLQAILFGGLATFALDPGPDVRISVGSIAACVATVAVGNVLYFLLKLPLQLLSFWHDNVWSLAVALRMANGLFGGALIPLAFFPEWGRAVLQWLPFRLLLDWPTRTLLGRVDAAEWWTSLASALAWCLVMATVSRAVWRRGELQYSGVGI